MLEDIPDWLTSGKGVRPQPSWSFTMDAPLIALELARETGEAFAADASGGLYLLDRRGRVVSVTRGLTDVRQLAWSDSGEAGAAIVGESRLCRLNRKLEVQWTVDLPEMALAVATDPFGHFISVSLANRTNLVFDSERRKVSQFVSIRPISFLRFCIEQTAIVAVADHGLLCCHQLDGEELWNERLLTTVGDVCISGDGSTILLASFNVGIQSYDGEGNSRGTFLTDGTASRISMSFLPYRMISATLEHHLYWWAANGDILWNTQVSEEIQRVLCEPVGNWALCGLAAGRIIRLDWT